jgi:hypothetical protein
VILSSISLAFEWCMASMRAIPDFVSIVSGNQATNRPQSSAPPAPIPLAIAARTRKRSRAPPAPGATRREGARTPRQLRRDMSTPNPNRGWRPIGPGMPCGLWQCARRLHRGAHISRRASPGRRSSRTVCAGPAREHRARTC